MILYGSDTSPFVRHCRIALLDAAIDFEFFDTDYADSAAQSPTAKVPFLKDGNVTLTDSSSILLHIKQKTDHAGFVDVADFDLYALVNTTLDAEINLFLLGKEGVTPDNNEYMKRQKERVQSSLKQLDRMIGSVSIIENEYSDGQIRLACLLDWGLYRNRFSLDEFIELSNFLNAVKNWEVFAETSPPNVN